MDDTDVGLLEIASQSETKNGLDAIKKTAKDLVALENRIADIEAELILLKKDREEIRIRTLPQLMLELGIDSVRADNHTVEIEPLTTASLPKERAQREAVIDWLVANGHGGIVKRELKVDLPKGDDVTADVVRDAVQEAAPELPVDVSYTVHHSSYTACMVCTVTSCNTDFNHS